MADSRCIPHNKIISYLKSLLKDYIVYYPIKPQKEIIFTNDPNRADEFYWGLSHIPPKQFFIPQKEELLRYKNNQPSVPSINTSKKIIFGLHPYDIKAIAILDKIFFEKRPDFYYQRRRNNFLIIGMGDNEFESYFEPDIFLNTNADTYEVILKNPVAKPLLDYKNIFRKSVFEPDNKYYKEEPLFSNIKELSQSVEKSHTSKIWDELAKIDLGCGICSYTCPLCYCFDLDNELCLENNCDAKKYRSHSSCYHKDFAETSSINFHGRLRERIYDWYHHKFVRMPREIGHVGCVDCGRCIKYCPAKINFKNVLKSLQ